MSASVETPPISLYVPRNISSGARAEIVVVPPCCIDTRLSALLLDKVRRDSSPPSRSDLQVEVPPNVSGHALRLCVEYMDYFAAQKANAEEEMQKNIDATSLDVVSRAAALPGSPTLSNSSSCLPTVLPVPLDRPLETILTPWENEFIAQRLLGNNGDAWEHADLLAVLAAAEFLQLESLRSLCEAWCGNQIWRMCKETSKSAEAAEMIRKFFGIENDWTDAEEECLRIENDWPEGEEE